MSNFCCLMVCFRNPKERAYHFTNQEAEAQRCYVLCPRSSSMWKNLDLNTDVKFRDIEIDQLLACSIEETLPFPRNKLTKKQKDRLPCWSRG